MLSVIFFFPCFHLSFDCLDFRVCNLCVCCVCIHSSWIHTIFYMENCPIWRVETIRTNSTLFINRESLCRVNRKMKTRWANYTHSQINNRKPALWFYARFSVPSLSAHKIKLNFVHFGVRVCVHALQQQYESRKTIRELNECVACALWAALCGWIFHHIKLLNMVMEFCLEPNALVHVCCVGMYA